MTLVGYGNLCAFLMSLSLGMFWVGLPYLVKAWFEARAWHLGLMAGIASVVYVLTCMLAGRISRTFQRHHVMACGALILVAMMILLRFAPSIWFVLLVLMPLAGFGQGLFWPALEAYLSDGVGPTKLRKRIGWFNLSWSSADMLGAFLGGGLYGLAVWLGQRWGDVDLQGSCGFLTGAIAMCIVVIALLRLHAKASWDSEPDARDGLVPKSPGRGGHASLTVFWIIALISNGTGLALRGTLVNVFPDFGKDILKYSPIEWGILLGSAYLARTLAFVYWQRRHAWEYRASYFFAVQALLPLASVILIFNSNYWVFLAAFMLTGVGLSLTYFASIFYSMDSADSHQHRSGIHEAVGGVGLALPLASGVLASATGSPRAPYVFLFILLTLAMGVQAVMFLRSRRANR